MRNTVWLLLSRYIEYSLRQLQVKKKIIAALILFYFCKKGSGVVRTAICVRETTSRQHRDNQFARIANPNPIQSRAFSLRARLTAFTALDIIESLLLIIPQYDN